MAKLNITEERMLQLMEYALNNNLVATREEYWEKIGFLRNNLSNLKSGKHGFTREQIRKTCLVTGANANWILGIDGPMFRDVKEINPLTTLRKALSEIEQQMKLPGLAKKTASNKRSNSKRKTLKK